MNLQGAIWHNEYGFTLRDAGRKTKGFLWHKRTVYECTADPIRPLTLQLGPQCYARPDRHGFTDLGSVPEPLQIIIPKDLHNPSYVVHDSACREHCLYVATELHGEYVPWYLSSYDAAVVLGKGFYAAGFTNRAYFAAHAVNRCGPQF